MHQFNNLYYQSSDILVNIRARNVFDHSMESSQREEYDYYMQYRVDTSDYITILSDNWHSIE